MKVTRTMVETLVKELQCMEKTMPGIQQKLEQEVSAMLETDGPITMEQVQDVTAHFDAVFKLIQPYDTCLLSYIRSLSKRPDMADDESIAEIKDARQKAVDMSADIIWMRDRVSHQAMLHNAERGDFKAMADSLAVCQEPDEDAG